MVVNVPDLGITPFGRGSGIGASITQLAAAYNATLESTLSSMDSAGIHTIRVDAFSTLQSMVNHPEQFGFTNVMQPFLATGGDPAKFLYWDQVHPTTRGHEVLAGSALQSLYEHFLKNTNGAFAPARVNALNGLVKADERRSAN
jgi:phospholipase/lecithinase/hemolysin